MECKAAPMIYMQNNGQVRTETPDYVRFRLSEQ